MQWLADEADRRVLMEARRGFDRELHIMQSEYGAGTVGILGSEEARVALERVQAQVLQAQSRLAGARLALEAVTGRPVSRRAPALPEKFDPPVMYSAVRWRRLAGRHNPLLASARALRHAASREVSGALGGFLPVVTLQFEHQQASQAGTSLYRIGAEQFQGPDSYRNLGNSVALELSWNLFAGGRSRAALAAAESRQVEAMAALAEERQTIQRDIAADIVAIRSARQRIRLYRASLNIARHAVVTSSEGLRAGLVSENNAIFDRRIAAKVELNLDAALTNAILHYVRLADAAGVITPIFIRRLSTVLQSSRPSGHA